jgi:hypothetical protein
MVNLNLELDMLEMTPVARHYLSVESRAAYALTVSDKETKEREYAGIDITRFARPNTQTRVVPPPLQRQKRMM